MIDKWNEAVTIEIPKKGDSTPSSNYREISLISTLCKIVTNIVADKWSVVSEKECL